jgi:hypothetical protein
VTATASKRILQPNEKATIRVAMDARRFSGPKSCAIWVTVGHPSWSEVRLKVMAVTRDDLVCNPGEVAFGPVEQGQTPSVLLDVEYAGSLALQIHEAVVPKGAPFAATVKELYRRPGRVGYQVKVSLKKDAPLGQFRQTLFLKTNDPGAALLPLQVHGAIQAPLKVVPAGEPNVRFPVRRAPAGS